MSLADQGNLGGAGESGAFVEPSGAGLVAGGPRVPVDDKPPGQGPDGEGGEQSLDLGDGQRDHAGLGGGRLTGPDRGRGLGVGAVLDQGGGDGADGEGGHDEHGVAGARGGEARPGPGGGAASPCQVRKLFYPPTAA